MDLLEQLAPLLDPDRAPQDSREKVAWLLGQLNTYRPANGVEAAVVLVLRPLMRNVQLPEPEQVDGALDYALALVAALKSDPGTVPQLTLSDLVCTCGAGAGPEPIGPHDPDCPRAVIDTTATEES